MQEAVQYIRVSSDEQAKGGSLKAQQREGGEYLKKQGLNLLAEFKDVETAKSSGREDFITMLQFLKKAKKPMVLLVEKTDRLYRNHEDMVAVQKLVKAGGHEVHLYKEGEILGPATPSHTWLIHYFKVAMATNYVENLSEEIKKGRKEKLLAGGYPHRAPYGYRNDKNTKTIVIDEDAARFVKEAFKQFGTGLYSLQRLGVKLHEDGFIYKPEISQMTKSGLAKLLKNPFYIGEMQVDGEIYPGKHEPLIDKALWLKVQEAFRKDGKPLTFNRQEFKYAHLLTCYECGSAFVGEHKKDGRYTYYRCSARKQGCSQGYIPEKELDKHFDRFIESLVIDPDIVSAILAAAQALANDTSLDEEISKTQAEIKRYRINLKRALQEKIDGNIDNKLYLEISQEYHNSIRRLEDKLSKITVSDLDFFKLANNLVDLPRTLLERWKTSNTNQKIRLLNIVSANFSISDGKMRYELKEPLSLIGKTALREVWWSIGDSNS